MRGTVRFVLPGLFLMSAQLFGLTGCACGGGDDSADALTRDSMDVRYDLLALSHLADIDHHGLHIDFGGPARSKYTVGDWGSGWGEDGADGDVTFTYVGRRGRIYFPMAEAGAVTLRFEMMPVGSRRMQVFLNGESQDGVVLEEGDVFRSYDVPIAADDVRAGENYLMVVFGGTEIVGGREVSAAMSSLRVIEVGQSDGGDAFAPPQWDTLASVVQMDGQERQALAVRAPTTLSYYVEVPDAARLAFGVGAEGGSLSARVTVTPEGGETTQVFEASPGAAWNDQVIDLSRFAGDVVRLDFSVDGDGSGRVAWAEPAILTPPVEAAERPEAAQNVIVLLVDTLRADRLRAYNPESRVETPTLDRMAEQGILFEAAQSPENWTKPACASVLTGLSPSTHGAKTDGAVLSGDAEMVSEAFDDAGFATASFIANGYVSDRFGFDQGWDDYNNFIREGRSTEAENVFEEAGDFIEAHTDERFFVYIQTIDPHVPYDPPAEYLRMYDRSAYSGAVQPRQTPDLLHRAKQHRVTFNEADQTRLEALHDGEISYHDHYLGQFLERLEQLGVAEDTLIVVTSDHGEEFDDHGSWGHGHTIFQELIGVPLIFYMPGRLPEGRRVSHTVSTLNIAQTVLDLSGVQGLERAEGRSLVPDLLGAPSVGPQVAFSDFQEIRRVARAGRYKLVVRANMSTVLFDLEADPTESEPLEIHERPIAGRYVRILLGQYLGAQNRREWLSAHQRPLPPLAPAHETEIDDTTRAQLRALGYAN